MGKYNWTIDDLKAKFKLLEELISHEKDAQRIELIDSDLNFLLNIFEEYDSKDTIQQPKYIDLYREYKTKYEEIKFLWSDFQRFNSLANSNGLKVFDLKKSRLSNDDLLSLTHDFYKSLDKFFFENFLKTFKDRQTHIRFQPYADGFHCGETISISALKESFIDIQRVFDLQDLFATVHEYSHATSVQINDLHLQLNKELYVEIDPLFMEIIFADYYYQQSNDKDAYTYRINNYLEYLVYSNMISLLLSLMNFDRQQEIKTVKGLRNGIQKSKFNYLPLEESFEYLKYPCERYITCYMIAIELYNIYKQDKDKALYLLRKIIYMSNLSSKQYYNNIKRLGINPNQSISNFQKELQSNMKRIRKR